MDYKDMWGRIQSAQERVRARWVQGVNKRSAIILAAIILPTLFFYIFVLSAPSSFSTEKIVTIEEGETLNNVALKFEDEDIVRYGNVFRAAVVLVGSQREIIAGDYQFHRRLSVFGVANRVTSGAFGLEPVKIRIPEGATAQEVATIFSKKLSRFDEKVFLAHAELLEGYLFPDTYFFLSNATAETVAKTMLDNFRRKLEEISPEIAVSEHSLEEIVTMASLLEKEAHTFEDKKKIAGVLWKRIEIGMPLQVDATFVYFLGKNTFQLTLEDLQIDSPFNTYRYKGLPPGPIANPGLDSLKAALAPEDTGALFYLADKNGETHFSETYAEHLRKKRLYLGT